MKIFIVLILLPAFISSYDIEEVKSAWRDIDRAFTRFSMQLAQKFSELRPILLSANISETCSNSIFQLQAGLNMSKAWAIKMLDASGKIPNGILNHKFSSLGDYYECIDIEAADSFDGKYCMVNFETPLPKREPFVPQIKETHEFRNVTEPHSVVNSYLKYVRLYDPVKLASSVCMPSTCTKEDLHKMLLKVVDLFEVKIEPHVSRCKTRHEQPTVDAYDIFSMSVLCSVILIGIIATVIDVYYRYKCEENDNEKINEMGYLSKGLLYFSFVKCINKLFQKVEGNTDTLNIFHGLRVLASCWVVLIHTTISVDPKVFNTIALRMEAIANPLLLLGYNTYLAVEVFFFMSAFLLAYDIAKRRDRDQSICLILVRRYFRICIPVFFSILIFSLLHLIDADLTVNENATSMAKICKEYGWNSLLFVNNYFPRNQRCNPPSWFLSVDFQLYVVATLILVPLRKKPKILFKLLAILFVISLCVISYLHVIYNFPPMSLIIYNIPDIDYINLRTYYKPHVHIPSYLIGMATGYILATKKPKQIPKKIDFVLWICSLITLIGVLFGSYFWNIKGETPSQIVSVIYAATHRWLWALALAWLTISSYYNKRSLVNMIFGSHFIVVLGRLSFMAYLIHYQIHLLYAGTTTSNVTYDKKTLVYTFIGNTVCAYIISVFLCVLYEIPFAETQRHVMSKLRR